MTITTDLLRTWSEALCQLARSEPRATVDALGLGGFTEETASWVTATPPPGARSARLSRRDGQIDFVELGVDGRAAPTAAQLEAAFGTPMEAPLIAGVPLLAQYLYRVKVPGAPFTCTIIAGFAGEPDATSVPHTLTLRRDRAT